MAQERIGRYRILEEIASGAQGAVYRALDSDAGRLVALKILHASLSTDRSYLERFHREASLAASIDHPNVVRIFDVGEADGRHFIAMEFLPENLARLIESGSLPVDHAASLAAQIADGLGAVHEVGIVHRDMKPQNVLIAPDGTAKVTDFGIARAESLSTMTATGVMMGTPYYMSPEQARGERADAWSDVYALGCVLYQMLTGEVPFQATTPLAVLRQHIEEQPRPLRRLRSDVPRELVGIVERAMEKDPARRFANGAEMARALRQAIPGLLVAPPMAARAEPRPASAGAPVVPPSPPPVAPRRRGPIRWVFGFAAAMFRSTVRVLSFVGTLVGIAVIVVVAIKIIQDGNRDSVPAAVPTAIPTPVGTPAPPEATAAPPVLSTTTPAPAPARNAAPASASTAGRLGSAAPAPSSASSAVWIRKESFTFDPLMAVVVAPDNTVHIGGEGGVFYRSVDGGETWSASKSRIDCQIRDLQLVSDGMWTAIDECDNGWIGTGAREPTWSRLADSQRGELEGHSIYFVDSETGWIGGHEGELSATRDGGNTWDRFKVPTRSDLNAVFFADANRGWVVGPDRGLLSTSDGGATWERVRVRSNCRIQKFAARLPLIWAVGDCGTVIFSPDGGVSWEDRSLQEDAELSAVDFVDDQTAWVAGMVSGRDSPTVLETNDGGATWHKAFVTDEFAGAVRDIVVEVREEGLVGWAVGTAGLLLQLVSVDDVPADAPRAKTPLASIEAPFSPARASLPTALTWERQREFTFDRLYSVEVVGRDRVYVGGDAGTIYRSRDGGVSWDLPRPVGHCDVRDVQFLSAQVGLALDSCGGSLLRTDDGGELWRRVSSGPLEGEDSLDMHFVDAEHGWVSGRRGLLARTDDGGKTWERLDVATAADLEAIHFVDQNNGWLGGVSGSILQTDDGGRTWIRANTPRIECGVRDIEVRLPFIWALDDCKGIYMSSNAGETWQSSEIRFRGRLRAVALWDEQTAWVGGALGDVRWPVLFETRDGGNSWHEVFRIEEPLGAIRDIVIEETPDGAVGWAVGEDGLIVKLVPATDS